MHNRAKELFNSTEKQSTFQANFVKAETFMTNLRWALHTVQHCIDVVHKHDDSDIEEESDLASDDLSEKQQKTKTFLDLLPFW